MLFRSAMDQGRTVEILKEAKVRGCVTTLDVFAASQEDFTLIEPLLPFTDYFMPSEEEAMALTGGNGVQDSPRNLAYLGTDFSIQVAL